MWCCQRRSCTTADRTATRCNWRRVRTGVAREGCSDHPRPDTSTPTWMYQVSDDLSILRGQHQFGLGANYIWSRYDPQSYTTAAGNTTFTGGTTGLGLADYMLG